jgi:hypothetical protein
MIAELVAKIKLDVTDLSHGEQAVRNFEETFKGAFKRTGDLRAGRALEDFIANLSSGNVTGALESIATRMTGLGLIGGVVFGSLATGIGFLVKNLHEVSEAFKAVDTATTETPKAGASIEQTGKAIENIFAVIGKQPGAFKEFWAELALGPGAFIQAMERTRKGEEIIGDLGKAFQRSDEAQKRGVETTVIQATAVDSLSESLVAQIKYEEELAAAQEKKKEQFRDPRLEKMEKPEREEAKEAIKKEATAAQELSALKLGLTQDEIALHEKLDAIKESGLRPDEQAVDVLKAREEALSKITEHLRNQADSNRKALDTEIQRLLTAKEAAQAHFDATALGKEYDEQIKAAAGRGDTKMVDRLTAERDSENAATRALDEKLKAAQAQQAETTKQDKGPLDTLDIERQRLSIQERVAEIRSGLAGRIEDIKESALDPQEQLLKTYEARIQALNVIRAIEGASNVEAQKGLTIAIDRLKQEQQRAEMADAAKRFQPIFEKTQLSLQELMAVDPRSTSPRIARAAHLAQLAQHETDLGMAARGRGDEGQAFRHLFEGERIRSRIPLLKESEKTPEIAFKEAINSASVFQAILNRLQGIEDNTKPSQGGNLFANQ